jgi:MAF protein
MDRPIILASASPRRREIFELLGVPFTVQPVSVDETPRPGETPDVLVARLSATKAATVAQQALTSSRLRRAQSSRERGGKSTAALKRSHFGPPSSLVVAADTVVVLDDQILGKPGDAAHAQEMLLDLRGRAHMVYTGVTVVETSSGRAAIHLSATQVWMRDYSQAEMKTYVASGDPLDKAGAYAIQHAGFRPVARVEGCFAGVMGLPLGALVDGLAHFDVTLPVDVATVCQRWTGYPCCRQMDV